MPGSQQSLLSQPPFNLCQVNKQEDQPPNHGYIPWPYSASCSECSRASQALRISFRSLSLLLCTPWLSKPLPHPSLTSLLQGRESACHSQPIFAYFCLLSFFHPTECLLCSSTPGLHQTPSQLAQNSLLRCLPAIANSPLLWLTLCTHKMLSHRCFIWSILWLSFNWHLMSPLCMPTLGRIK